LKSLALMVTKWDGSMKAAERGLDVGGCGGGDALLEVRICEAGMAARTDLSSGTKVPKVR
jgi:hypothetical protein